MRLLVNHLARYEICVPEKLQFVKIVLPLSIKVGKYLHTVLEVVEESIKNSFIFITIFLQLPKVSKSTC